MESVNEIDLTKLWTPVLQYYSTYDLAHLKPVIHQLVEYALIVPKSKTNNVYKKYSSLKLSEAAKITEKSEAVLRHLLNIKM